MNNKLRHEIWETDQVRPFEPIADNPINRRAAARILAAIKEIIKTENSDSNE